MPKNNILLIDDSPGISALMLESRGYKVSVALDGLDGIEKAANERPDLILLDIMMPDMDGYEVCMRLRAMPDTKETPIIMLTVKDDPESVTKCFDLGANSYIVKPFNLPTMVRKLSQFLDT